MVVRRGEGMVGEGVLGVCNVKWGMDANGVSTTIRVPAGIFFFAAQ